MATELAPAVKPKIGPPVYIAAAIALAGAGLFAYLQFAPSRPSADIELTPEAKAYVTHLRLTDAGIKATESYFKQVVVEITGNIGNAGERPVEAIEIYCVFRDAYGQTVLRKRVPIVNARMGGLKPGETQAFRLAFDEIPESWNHAPPVMVIAGIKFS